MIPDSMKCFFYFDLFFSSKEINDLISYPISLTLPEVSEQSIESQINRASRCTQQVPNQSVSRGEVGMTFITYI